MQKQEGTPINEHFRHAWLDESRNGMYSFQKELKNGRIRKAIEEYYREPAASGKNRVLIIDGDERVSGFSVYCFFDGTSRHIGFTEEDPSFFYVLEDRRKWKPVLAFRNIWSSVLEHRYRYNPFVYRSAQYVAKGHKAGLDPAGDMRKHLKNQIKRQRRYIEGEAHPTYLDRETLALLKFRAFGYGNAALKEIMKSHGHKTDRIVERELKKVTELYEMAGFLDTRNVQRKLENERKDRVTAREAASRSMLDLDDIAGCGP